MSSSQKFIPYFLNHMANLEFCDKHNMVAYLQKSEGSEGFHQMIDFLNASHIQYALTENPTIYVSFIKQFWSTTTALTSANGKVELTATIDGQVKTITEAFLRRHLKLKDNGGVNTLPNSEIFEQLALMGLEAKLAQTKQTYGIALTKLIKKVKKLEQTRRRFRIVVSDDEECLEDPSKQGRKITEIDQDPSILLVVLEEEDPTELVEDQGSGEKGEKEVNTVDAKHSTVIPEVSTVAENLVYIRRSAKKKKDKGKGIMIEPELEKKTKKQLEQERLGHEEASDPVVLRYHAQLNRPYSVAEVRKNMVMYLKNQGGYKMNYFKGMKYEDIRPIFEKVCDQIQSFASMDSEKEKGSEKK
ncbi:hypothetical protein Tco_0815222 [Tanacetum coccineum]